MRIFLTLAAFPITDAGAARERAREIRPPEEADEEINRVRVLAACGERPRLVEHAEEEPEHES